MANTHHQYNGITLAKNLTQLLVFWLALLVLNCQADEAAPVGKPPAAAWVSNLHSFAAGGTSDG